MPSKHRSLVRELTSGQRSAYVQAIDQHYQRIYAFLYRLAQDATLAEDLTQETFTAAWNSLDQFEGRASFATWLHKIALNMYRRHRRQRREVLSSGDIEDELGAPDPAPDVIDSLQAKDLQERIEQAVMQLPEAYRETVILRCYQGLKYREVAELLEVPLGTVQYRLHIALGKLRQMLRQEVPDCETIAVRHGEEISSSPQ